MYNSRPMGRGVERGLLFVAAAWNVLLASMTLFMYSPWFRNAGYDVLERAGRMSSASLVGQVASIVNLYASALLVIGVVSFLLAALTMRPGTISRGLTVWLSVALMFSLLTADWVSLALYSVALALYVARNKAIRAQRTAVGQQ